MLHEINGIDWLIDLLRKWWDINCLYYKGILTQFVRLPIKNTFAKQKKGNKKWVPPEKGNLSSKIEID